MQLERVMSSLSHTRTNGGYNGLKDRQRRFDLYMKGQTPEGDVKGIVMELIHRYLHPVRVKENQ